VCKSSASESAHSMPWIASPHCLRGKLFSFSNWAYTHNLIASHKAENVSYAASRIASGAVQHQAVGLPPGVAWYNPPPPVLYLTLQKNSSKISMLAWLRWQRAKYWSKWTGCSSFSIGKSAAVSPREVDILTPQHPHSLATPNHSNKQVPARVSTKREMHPHSMLLRVACEAKVCNLADLPKQSGEGLAQTNSQNGTLWHTSASHVSTTCQPRPTRKQGRHTRPVVVLWP
jgi:hypothetical protein